MKKILVLLMTSLLFLSGCSSKDKVDYNYDDVMNEAMDLMISPTDFSINFSFQNPEKYGIKPEPYKLEFSTKEDTEESYDELREVLKKLKSIDSESLTKEQALDKEVVEYYFQTQLDGEKYYDFEVGSGFIGYERSFLASLPSYLEAYTFRTKQDVDGYFSWMQSIPKAFKDAAEFEVIRQENGTGYGKQELDEIVKQAESISKSMKDSNYFIIKHFNKEMDKLDFLSSDEKSKAKKKHADLINNELSKSYQTIADILVKIDAKDSTGLAKKKDGKAYYEYLLSKEVGKKITVKEVKSLLDKKEKEALQYISYVGEENFGIYLDRMFNDQTKHFKDGRELLTFVENNYTEHFPEIDKVNYDLRKVDASVEEGSSPAFYFTPTVDYDGSEPQVIYINGEFDNSKFTTYAHEGMPGHMYQFSYFRTKLNQHPIRDLMSFNGNAEGWANYAESFPLAYLYDEDYMQFYRAYMQYVNIISIRHDIGVNYEGWDLERFKLEVKKMLDMDDEALEAYYYQIVHTPATIPTYYLGNILIEELYYSTARALDEKISYKEFHEAFLNVGPAPFDVVEHQLKLYIDSKK